ncbi:response regulator transcription factor [Streptomyces amakusaensis]|uniref:Response regulator transcription factor n=1 Tax=Streptomyces amakusaensis TaxID=67271 RepID=A0ABW0AKA6_9ACTN
MPQPADPTTESSPPDTGPPQRRQPTGTENLITVEIRADDLVSQTGMTSLLRSSPKIRIQNKSDGPAAVIVLVVDALDDARLDALRTIRRTTSAHLMLVVTHLEAHQIAEAAECGVLGILRRGQITSHHQLVDAVKTVGAGLGYLPADLQGALLGQIGRLYQSHRQSEALTVFALMKLSHREQEVLRDLSHGHEITEIAERQNFSVRTVKYTLHGVTGRYQLRNRTHAVGMALRKGLI